MLDLDDTITDRQATIRVYAQRFLSDFGDRLDGVDLAALTAGISRFDGNGYNRNRAIDLAANAGWRASPGADVLAEHWERHFAELAQARDGLEAAIDTMTRAGLRLGVVTNGRTHLQWRKIDALGLRERFGAVLISEEFGAKKPDERIFRAAAAGLGVSAGECMFVGDHPENDVRGAAAVGMRAVWLRSVVPWPDHLEQPRETVASLAEVLQLLRLA